MRDRCLVSWLLASTALVPGVSWAQPSSGGPVQQSGAVPVQQSGGAPAQPANAPAGVNGLGGSIEQVVVTAEKRTQTAQRTPIAIRVVSGRTLQANRITDVQNLVRVAPDLGVVQNTVYTQLSIRGVSAQTIAEGADAALTVDIDGEYINRPVGLNASFFDLSRVEVLKGPQGTLYGRNATAGAINIITAKPMNKYEGYITAGAGNYGATNVEGALNIPITTDLAVRLAGFHAQRGGYLDNGRAGHGDDNNQTGARVSINYTHDALTAYVSGEYINIHSVAPPTQYGVPLSATSPGLVQVSGVDSLGQTVTDLIPRGNLEAPLPRNGDFPLNDLGFFRTEQYHLRDKLSYDFGNGLVAEYVGGYYSNHTATAIPLTGEPNYLQFYSRAPHLDSDDLSNDVHLSYHAPSGLFAQIGAFYFHEKQDVESTIQIDHPPFGPPGTQRAYVNYFYFPKVTDSSYAFYGQADYPVLPNLKVTGGVRYSHDEKQGTYYNNGFGFIDPQFGLFAPTISQLAHAAGGVPSQCGGETSGANFTIINHCYSQGEVNWLAGLEYTPAPDHLLYFKASTAYRSGGFDNASGQISNGVAIPDFQPEHITAYEVGSKNSFLNQRLQLNLDLFRYDYSNLQVDSFLNTTIGHFTANAGQATYNGAELDGIAAITDDDRLSFTFNYLDSHFNEFRTVETGLAGNAVPVNLAGNTPPQASKWTITAGYDHTFELGRYGSLLASVLTRYRSKFFLTAYNFDADRQTGFTSTDISLTYTTPNGKYSLQGFAHNLEDYRPLVYTGFTAGPPVNIFNFGFGAPLTFGVQGTARF